MSESHDSYVSSKVTKTFYLFAIKAKKYIPKRPWKDIFWLSSQHTHVPLHPEPMEYSIVGRRKITWRVRGWVGRLGLLACVWGSIRCICFLKSCVFINKSGEPGSFCLLLVESAVMQTFPNSDQLNYVGPVCHTGYDSTGIVRFCLARVTWKSLVFTKTYMISLLKLLLLNVFIDGKFPGKLTWRIINIIIFESL